MNPLTICCSSVLTMCWHECQKILHPFGVMPSDVVSPPLELQTELG